MSLKRAAFLDRDGVIVVDHGYVWQPAQLDLVEGAAAAIRGLRHAGYLIVVASNQSGVARGYFTAEQVEAFHGVLQQRLSEHGAALDAIYWCPYHPCGVVERYRMDHEDRKPRPGMLLRAIADHAIDPTLSFMVGDKPSDMQAAAAAGVKGFLYAGDEPLDAFLADRLGKAALML